MNRIIMLAALMSSFFSASAQMTLKSPDGRLSVKVFPENKKIFYEVFRGTERVIAPSVLGIKSTIGDFSEEMRIQSTVDQAAVTNHYSLLSGKKTSVSFKENRAVVNLVNKKNQKLSIKFRVTNDAFAFQYNLPGNANDTATITKELTEYHFPAETKSWLQPMQYAKTGWEQTNPAYEEHYFQAIPVSRIKDSLNTGWVYPALFNTGKSWIAVTEAGMTGQYCATRLLAHPTDDKFSIAFPDPREVVTGKGYLPQGNLPISSPWRVVAIGNLGDIVESTAGTDFAGEREVKDTNFVKPGRSSWSWINSKDNFIVYEEQKKYIDFAAAMHWEYCLIDVDWDQKIGYDKIKALADYAKTKNVGILLWYNSAGDWNTVKYTPKNLLLNPESRMKEFSRIHEMGIKGVKIDFFAGDGQSVMQYYIDILKDAEKYQLMVNFHGATLPRGWSRTYPHLMTAEAIRGFENVTFQQAEADRQAEICATAPFTRNLFDPMDYTPMNLYKLGGKIQRRTSSAFELALSVLFVSGIQHYAESPEGMSHVPENVQGFLRELPGKWDDTKFIDGYPGKYAVIARRAGKKWYIAGINSEKSGKTFILNTLSFGKNVTMIKDGDDPLTFAQTTGKTMKDQKVEMPSLGGFVMVIQ